MTDGNAQLVEVYDYEAFGNQLLSQGGLATPYRYVGQLGYYRHDDIELDLLGARYYAPEFGPESAQQATSAPHISRCI
jgi:hypothetical protein